MKVFRTAVVLLLFLSLRLASAHAQAAPTATQQLELSAFGGATGVFTDLLGGHNASITAGADLRVFSYHRYLPSLEFRGTIPVHSGTIDGQKSFLGGLKIDRDFDRFRPYADFLVGRGQIDYQRGGFTVGPLTYLSTTTTVLSPGLGVDYMVTDHWSAKADFQYQFWDTPVVPSGSIHPKVLTLGAVYRFDFNHNYRHPKHDAPIQ